MERKIHLNQEFIKGFIESKICQFEQDVDVFIKYLSGFEILFTKQENGLWLIKTAYAIHGDTRNDLFAYFELSEHSKIEAFYIKVELALEEIYASVQNFNKNG